MDDWLPSEDGFEDFAFPLDQRTEELYDIPGAEPDENGVIECPVLVLKDLVVYPQMISPIFLSPGPNLLAVQEARFQNQTLVGLALKNKNDEHPAVTDFLPIGVELAVGRLLNLPKGDHSSLVQGRSRVEVVEFTQLAPYYRVKVRLIDEPTEVDQQTDALMRAIRYQFERVIHLNRSIPDEAYLFSLNINEPGWLADMVATAISPPLVERQALLMLPDPYERLKSVSGLLAKELDVLELEDEIQTQVQKEVDKSQREYYLREQMKAIQNELGEGDIWTREVNEFRKRILELDLPEEVRTQAQREVERLEQTPPMSPEVGIIRNYLEWVLDLPWSVETTDNLDIQYVGKVLERDHYGLKKAKDRIVEYIAVMSLKPKRTKQPILCFIGPPGTGKTSLGKSIAEAIGRKFVRVSLGGVRDEAEIRGHRRTYIGSMPGRILQTLKRAGTKNPVFMLDEVDKLGNDFRGDPASALLEVLDPEQNHSFSDHYLEVAYDLSSVLFITTANSVMTIPPALLDRMEVIEFPGYIEEEKLEIATRFLIPRQIEENGLEPDELQFSETVLRRIISEYTLEAGVRNFEREIGKICRKIARIKAEKKTPPGRVTVTALERYLGPPQYFTLEAEKEDEIGVATAVAWTENGGEIMPVEVLQLDGKGNLQITGQVGDVMQESAQAALSYMKSRVDVLDIDVESFDNLDFHIHIPEGAVPKDGPSAGVTIAVALISAMTDRKVRKEVGMTGEITLRGKVLPVGGLREKILAAHRSGLKVFILPERNMKDLVEVSPKVKNDLKIVPVVHMDQVLEVALYPAEEASS